PGHAVVDLEDRRSSGSHNPPAFLDQFPIVRCVLDDAVSVDEIEGVVRIWKVFAVRLTQIRAEALLREVLLRERNCRRGQIDTGDLGAGLREAHQIDSGATADLEHALATVRVEIDHPGQVMELLEMILVESREEAG